MKKLELLGAKMLTKEEMNDVKGGQLIGCEAGSHSFESKNADLMYAWARAWAAAGYSVRCYYIYEV